MHKNFKKIKNKKKFIDWLLRHYFDQEKNLESPWFSFSVNEQTVLEYISKSENKFPYTPVQLLDMWTTILSFKKDISKKSREIDSLCDKIEEVENNYHKPSITEHTFQEIGKELGGITATMVNRLSNSAYEKIKKLTFEKHFHAMSDEEEELCSNAIYLFRKRAADKHVSLLMASHGDLNAFFHSLKSKGIMTEKEINMVNSEECELLLSLYPLPKEDIVDFLLWDIKREVNYIKSYQSMIAHEAFPNKKRGRPRKDA